MCSCHIAEAPKALQPKLKKLCKAIPVSAPRLTVPPSFRLQPRYFFLPFAMSRAAILARLKTKPEFVSMASGHLMRAASCKSAKSSSVIFTFTWMVRFILIE